MSELSERVYEKLIEVRAGQVTTYAELAQAVGIKGGARAIGNIMNKNPQPIIVPCHRVVRTDGSVGGYAYGQSEKSMLLESEGVKICNGRIENMKNIMHKF